MDKDTMEPVARKFQAWAEALPTEEQQVLATWLSEVGGDEIQGYAAGWHQAPDAWRNCMLDCC